MSQMYLKNILKVFQKYPLKVPQKYSQNTPKVSSGGKLFLGNLFVKMVFGTHKVILFVYHNPYNLDTHYLTDN